MTDILGAHEKTEHGCAIVLGRHGLLIRGPSGSGKSLISHLLIERWQQSDCYASWVADDRVILTASGMEIVAKPASVLAGLHEQRFAGIQNEAYVDRAVIDYLVDLREKNQLHRMPEPQFISLAPNCRALPVIQAPAGEPNLALSLISTVLAQKSR